MRKRILKAAIGAIAVTAVTAAASTLWNLRVPEPSGAFSVGRRSISWIDPARAETHSPKPDDLRQVPAIVWYPARPGTGTPAKYLSGGSQGLAESGELSRLQVAGLAFIRHNIRQDAEFAAGERYPVILLSPGNATNVSFYASIAEELASRGYVVVGLDHPFHVAAVRLDGGGTALYDRAAMESPESASARILERVADIRLALDRLGELARGSTALGRHLDLERVGVMGHSNGGIAAVEACRADDRLDACLNIDGQMAGGPFSFDPEGGPPPQPFMYLTKEAVLHPVLHERFEGGRAGNLRVVIPDASHDGFADGALFEPALNPFDSTARKVITTTKGFVTAFFDRTLRGAPERVLGRVDAPADVYVNVYPLGKAKPIPAG